jgi:hypothetical protein
MVIQEKYKEYYGVSEDFVKLLAMCFINIFKDIILKEYKYKNYEEFNNALRINELNKNVNTHIRFGTI